MRKVTTTARGSTWAVAEPLAELALEYDLGQRALLDAAMHRS